MLKVIVAEPIIAGLDPRIYFNRLEFWKHCWSPSTASRAQFVARPIVIGPKRNIRAARDEAVQAALSTNATHLFFIDDDILVPPNILEELLKADKDIIGGLMHNDKGDPIVFQDFFESDGKGGLLITETFYENHPKSGVFQCTAIGTGCMLIKVNVLKTLHNSRPDIRFLFNYDHTARSMDVNFCRLARSEGFTVWCWPDIPCEQMKVPE